MSTQVLVREALSHLKNGRLQKAEDAARAALDLAESNDLMAVTVLQAVLTDISLRVLRDQYAINLDNAIRNILIEEKYADPKRLERFGYKVYCQTDEDGIIAEIFNRIGITSKKFIEFGVESGLENNTLFLLYQGWKGLWIEADTLAYEKIRSKFASVIANKQLTVLNSFVTVENINVLIGKSDIGDDIDLLSIDIDGNDYHVFEAITVIKPRVVVIEYNAKFPGHVKLVPEYDSSFVWRKTDYMGASLKSLEVLAEEKGYVLVGTNISGVNAFFVRKDLAENYFAEPASAEHLYNPSRYWMLHLKSGHPPDFGDYFIK